MPEYITVKEWARLKGVPAWKARRWATAGLIKSRPPRDLMLDADADVPKPKRGRPKKGAK